MEDSIFKRECEKEYEQVPQYNQRKEGHRKIRHDAYSHCRLERRDQEETYMYYD